MLLKTIAAARRHWLAHRLYRVHECMRRERALHRQHMAQLRAELDALQLRLALAHAGAASIVRERAPS